MKKGKLLEITLRIVQESLKDKEDTQILSNFKIANTSGRKREFDIVVKAFINKFELLIAIECKDYNTAVTVEKIEAFHSKCLRIPQIHKKIFVSKNGFQVDAINAAKDFGIELYRIEDFKEEVLKDWLSVCAIKPVSRFIDFKKIRVWTNPTLTNPEFNYDSIIYDDKTNEKQNVQDFIVNLLKQNDFYRHSIYISNGDDKQDRVNDYSIEIESLENKFLLNVNNEKYYLTKMYVIFSLTERIFNGKVQVQKIISDEKEMSTVITHETDGQESLKLVLKDNNPNKFDTFIINNETGEIFDSGFTFEYVKINDKI